MLPNCQKQNHKKYKKNKKYPKNLSSDLVSRLLDRALWGLLHLITGASKGILTGLTKSTDHPSTVRDARKGVDMGWGCGPGMVYMEDP